MGDIFDFGPRVARYAVMGNPIAHSRSPRIHSLFAEQTRQHIEYTAIQVDAGGFRQAVGNFEVNGGKGLNVTVPFKQEAWELADVRSALAERAGAVNTLSFESGRVRGDNTDGVGLLRDLQVNHGLQLAGRQVLLLGAGGAARGVLEPLLEAGPARLVIANRTPMRAAELAAAFRDLGPVAGGSFEALAGDSFDLVINATAASLHDEVPPLPAGLLTAQASCYDLMYGARPTAFLRWARAAGARQALDGLGMLVEQAAESFYIWRGVRPDTAPVIETLRRELESTV